MSLPNVEDYLCFLRWGGSTANHAPVLHHPLCSGVTVDVQAGWKCELFVLGGIILVAFHVVEGDLPEFVEKQPDLVDQDPFGLAQGDKS